MVCKEELCKWFKNLRPHQRIDYMCGLLHMCLPLELRFLGSVLEDHGKKNYNYLRDAELKANNNSEISKLYSGTERQLRATVSVYLSLLHSSNTACAQLLYEVLEKNLDRAFTFGTDPNDNEEIRMALTLAINHPAFQFHQKNSLYQHFARNNPESSDRRSKNTEKLDLSEEQPLLVNNPTADTTVRELQGYISNIELKDSKRQGKKLEVKFNVTWSNGDVFELTKTGREMHEFQLQLRDLFPDQIELQKREWKMLFLGHYHQHGHGHGHGKEDQSRSFTNYFSMLLRNQAFLRHEDVLEFFKGGILIHQAAPEPEVVQPPCITRVPLAQMSVNTGEDQGIPPFPLKSLTVCNSQLHHFPPNFMVASEQSIRLPRRNSSDIQPPPPSNVQRLVCPHGVLPRAPQVESPSQSPPSSTTESPLNSRSASPAHNHPHAAPDGCTETKQLLQLLNLELYTDTLGKLSLKQLKSQTPEDLSRAGLPLEAQKKLRSKLDNINREKNVPSVNGLVDGSSSGGTLSPASPNSIPWNQIHPSYLLPLPYSPTYSPTVFAQYPNPAAPQPPLQQQDIGDASPHDSDTDSPTAQIGVPKDKTDSSGSDDNDKDKSLLGENDKPRQDGRRRIYSSRTLPQHRGPTYTHHVGEESKPGIMRLPSSVNVYAESKQDLPQAATMSSYNGYQSDPNPSPVTSNNYPRPAYYPPLMRQIKPSPAHTNISMHNKNIINMPQEGHIKQQQPMVMYYPQGVRTDIPMTTSVMPINLNNNTVTNQTYSANNEGNVPNNSQRQYLQTMMSRQIVLPAPRSMPNLNNISSVSVTQGVSQPLPGHSPGPGPGPANISVKPTNGVPLPIPNPSGTPPESVHSGSDSPLQMLHNSSAGTTTVTLSTATSFASTPQTAVSSASHPQCSSCGCNCNLTSSTQSGYQPHFNTLPYHFLMHPGLVNGMMAPFSNMAYGHVPPPNYPNGISHEMYNHPSFPQHMHPVMAPHIVQSMYGNLSHHGQGNPATHTKHKPQGCYNCGSPQHKAQECKDPSMDGMSGNYHLNYKPKSDSD